MRTRLAVLAALGTTTALVVTPALASPKPATLDGVKTKTLTLTQKVAAVSHDSDLATGSLASSDRTKCAAPRCAALTFVYKPGKGVKGDALLTVSWTNPSSDFDLYLAAVDGSGTRTKVASCGAAAGTSEKVFVPAGTMAAGGTYALVVDLYRTAGDTAKASISMPASPSSKTTVPAAADALAPTNCGL